MSTPSHSFLEQKKGAERPKFYATIAYVLTNFENSTTLILPVGLGFNRVLPFNWRELKSIDWLRDSLRPMAARKTDHPNAPDLSFFLYLAFAHGKPSCHNRPLAILTSISRNVEIFFSHNVIHHEAEHHCPGPYPGIHRILRL